YPDALEMYEKTGEMVPARFAPIHLKLARVRDKLGDSARAKSEYRGYLQLAPQANNRHEILRRLSELSPGFVHPSKRRADSPGHIPLPKLSKLSHTSNSLDSLYSLYPLYSPSSLDSPTSLDYCRSVIKSIGVIGAGTMGNGIAQVAARAGYTVVMQDIKREFLD